MHNTPGARNACETDIEERRCGTNVPLLALRARVAHQKAWDAYSLPEVRQPILADQASIELIRRWPRRDDERRHILAFEHWFWLHVRGTPGCWSWLGPHFACGYGAAALTIAGKRLACPAQRMAYALACGPVPAELYACHRCNNPGCVRPSHIYIATPGQNHRDAWRDGLCSSLPGALHPMAQLELAEVRAMRRAFNLGQATQLELAATYGVDRGNVAKIVRGQLWKHDLLPDGPPERTAKPYVRRKLIADGDRDLAAALYLSGMSADEVAEQLDRTTAAIKTWLRDDGVRKR